MKRISDLIDKVSVRNSSTEKSRNTSAPSRNEKWTVTLFGKMKAIYGHRWVSQWTTEAEWQSALDEWTSGIEGLGADEMRRGIEHCRMELDWPPSIASFRKAALLSDDRHAGAAYRIHGPHRLLKADPGEETAVVSFAKMKEKLR